MTTGTEPTRLGSVVPNPVTTFEVLGRLYEARYQRLRPGKDESGITGRSSSEPENMAQFDRWLKTLALADACARIENLETRIEEMEANS